MYSIEEFDAEKTRVLKYVIYKKRTEKTTNPFIETNPEVIAKCIDLIVKQVNKPLSEINVGEEGLKKLLESGSFQKLYPMLLKSQKQNQYSPDASDHRNEVRVLSISTKHPLVMFLYSNQTPVCKHIFLWVLQHLSSFFHL